MNSKSFIITQRSGKQHEVIVDADRYDEVAKYTVTVIEVGPGRWYAVLSSGSKHYGYLHHFIAGKPPKGMVTDHINRNRLDNRRENLRHCTHAQNQYNRLADKPIGGKGICYVGSKARRLKPWMASCTFQNKPVRLGNFATAQEAQDAYNEFAAKNHGEFFCPGVLNAEAVAEIEAAHVAKYPPDEMRCIYQSWLIANPWLVKVGLGKKRHYLGVFPTIQAAQQARDQFIQSHTEAQS